ncbi:MAG: YraN family protein [Oscillospiraceae bacterium]
MNRGNTGAMGEQQAASNLEDCGYKIIARNYSCRFGEIDIIAQKGGYLVFCEVKTRGTNPLVAARESVDVRKQKRLKLAAQDYLANNQTDLQPRFDYIEVTAFSGKFSVVNHIENAFW